MYKKIVGIFILGLFFGTSFIPSISGNIDDNKNVNNEDIVILNSLSLDQPDQICQVLSGFLWLGFDSLAQSFRPTLNKLTKVQLEVGNYGSPPGSLKISIRSSLSGQDLTSISLPSSTFFFL